jgi:serine/threonine protein kinase
MPALSLGNILGKGSFGTTYEAHLRADSSSQHSVSRSVAAKKLTSNDVSQEALESFKKESQQLFALQHPSLAKMVGCGVTDAKYVVSEYITGTSLWAFLRTFAAPTPHWILQVARQIAEALRYLHSVDVIHGAFKTKNVIVDKDTNAIVKDYGYLDIKDNVPPEDVDPTYTAPELLAGRTYNEKVDVYSFAMVLLECFTRKSPWQGIPAESIPELIERSDRPPIPETVPPVFERLIRTCWHQESDSRPSFEKICSVLRMPEDRLLGIHTDAPTGPVPIAAPSVPSIYQQAPDPIGARLAALQGPSTPTAATPSAPSGRPAASRPAAPASEEESTQEVIMDEDDIRVMKPKPLSMRLEQSLDVEQERKLVVVLSKVTDMLNSMDPATQIKAIAVLADLVKDELRVLYVAKKSRVVRDLVDLITDTDPNMRAASSGNVGPYEVTEATLRALSQMAQLHPAMARALGSHKAVVPLVDLLGRENESLVMLSAKVLTDLATDPQNREAIRKGGGLFPLINLLRSENELVQVQAAWTLSEVLDDDANQSDFILSGGLRLLAAQLETAGPGLRLRVLDALVNFYGNDKARDVIANAGLKEKFINMLASPSPVLRSTAQRAMLKFSRIDGFIQGEMEAIKIFKALLDPLSAVDIATRDKLTICQALANFMKMPDTLPHLRDIGGLSHIVRVLSSDRDEEVRLHALYTLGLAIDDGSLAVPLGTTPPQNTNANACRVESPCYCCIGRSCTYCFAARCRRS